MKNIEISFCPYVVDGWLHKYIELVAKKYLYCFGGASGHIDKHLR